MSEAIPLPPEPARGVPALARALVAAARTWTLYPRTHPAVQMSLTRRRAAVRVMRRRNWLARRKARGLKQASIDALRRIGTPPAQQAVAEAAMGGDRLLRHVARHAAGPTHG